MLSLLVELDAYSVLREPVPAGNAEDRDAQPGAAQGQGGGENGSSSSSAATGAGDVAGASSSAAGAAATGADAGAATGAGAEAEAESEPQAAEQATPAARLAAARAVHAVVDSVPEDGGEIDVAAIAAEAALAAAQAAAERQAIHSSHSDMGVASVGAAAAAALAASSAASGGAAGGPAGVSSSGAGVGGAAAGAGDDIIEGLSLRQGGRRPERPGASNAGGVREAPNTEDVSVRDDFVDDGSVSDGDATGRDPGDEHEAGFMDRMLRYRQQLGGSGFPAMLHMHGDGSGMMDFSMALEYARAAGAGSRNARLTASQLTQHLATIVPGLRAPASRDTTRRRHAGTSVGSPVAGGLGRGRGRGQTATQQVQTHGSQTGEVTSSPSGRLGIEVRVGRGAAAGNSLSSRRARPAASGVGGQQQVDLGGG